MYKPVNATPQGQAYCAVPVCISAAAASWSRTCADSLSKAGLTDAVTGTDSLHWILRNALDQDFKMQMGAGCPARCTHCTQVLTLADALATLHVDTAQMGIDRGVVIGMSHHHHIAEAVLHARKLHYAIAYTAHWRAGGCCVIHTQMRPPGLQDGVKAHLEAAGNARKLHGRCQISTAQAFA